MFDIYRNYRWGTREYQVGPDHVERSPLNLEVGIVIGSAPSYAHDPHHVPLPPSPKQLQVQVEMKDAN